MAHYYFHVHNSTGVSRDDEGIDAPDFAAARSHAVAGIRSIIGEEAKTGRLDLRGYIEVNDERDETLLIIRFEEAFQVFRGDEAT